jgi:hypothetical protein
MSEAEPANLAAASSAPPVAPPAPPPPAPRQVTPAASRRAWREPRVQFWWAVAVGLLLAGAFLAARELVAWNADARLIRGGTKVDAVVWRSGTKIKGRPLDPNETATVEFHLNGQPQVLMNQRMVGRENEKTFSGETIPIYVDPEDPTKWTARAQPAPLLRTLAGTVALACVAAALLLVSAIKRRGVLAVWRGGEARQAAVVETSQTALAPRSRLVRCALTDGADRRLINVYVPRRAADPQAGDVLWLIMPPARPDKAIAAMLYE